MKTVVVPAQITTVEDKIAGSFTLPQIVLLVISLVIGSAIYAVVMPKMHLGAVKTALIAIEGLFFCGLAIRFHGKIVGEWLVIYLRFRSRPKKYVFTKNDLFGREIITETRNREKVENRNDFAQVKESAESLTLLEELRVKKIMDNDSLSISFKPSKKGGLSVNLKQKEN